MPNHALQFDYILVIQFLNSSDCQTGEELVKRLSESHTFPVELVVCETREDVVGAISDATRDVEQRGVPLVHFEAHGRPEFDGQPAAIGYRRDTTDDLVEPSFELALWTELWPLLRKLNFATDFNLIVIGAACFGDEVARGLIESVVEESVQIAPYMAAVGFVGTVLSGSLFDAMVSLYENLHRGIASLDLAVREANRCLLENEALSVTWTGQVLREVVAELANVDTRYYLERIRAEDPSFEKSESELASDLSGWQQLALEKALSGLLSYATHPHNRERFR